MGTIDWLRQNIGFIEMTKIEKFGNSFNNNELSFIGICCCYSIYIILNVAVIPFI